MSSKSLLRSSSSSSSSSNNNNNNNNSTSSIHSSRTHLKVAPATTMTMEKNTTFFALCLIFLSSL